MRGIGLVCLIGLLGLAVAAMAEPSRIVDKAEFVKTVQGKTLSRPLIKLFVTEDGNITGSGASLPVSGSWKWQDGYFCRDMRWGKRDLGYNCQEVKADSKIIRFTSDRGAGDHADFKLR